MPQASSSASSASSTDVGADRRGCEGVGGGGLSVRISGLGRSSAATLAAELRPGVAPDVRLPVLGGYRGWGCPHVVPVGHELLTAAVVFDADDAGFGELAHRPVDGVDRATKAAGQGMRARLLRTRRLDVPGRSPAVACRVYVTSAGPSGVPPLGDVVVARATARDRGSASPDEWDASPADCRRTLGLTAPKLSDRSSVQHLVQHLTANRGICRPIAATDSPLSQP